MIEFFRLAHLASEQAGMLGDGQQKPRDPKPILIDEPSIILADTRIAQLFLGGGLAQTAGAA